MPGTLIKCARCGRWYSTKYSHGCICEDMQATQLELPLPRDPLLVEREKTHGSFNMNACIFTALMNACRIDMVDLNPRQYLALTMIFGKLARLLQKPMVKDHWKDISGYSLLGMEACDK